MQFIKHIHDIPGITLPNTSTLKTLPNHESHGIDCRTMPGCRYRLRIDGDDPRSVC